MSMSWNEVKFQIDYRQTDIQTLGLVELLKKVIWWWMGGQTNYRLDLRVLSEGYQNLTNREEPDKINSLVCRFDTVKVRVREGCIKL